MTRKEFIEKVQNQTEIPIYGKDELDERIDGFWVLKYWKKNLNAHISNYEVLCDYPLWKVLKMYDERTMEYYHSSFYDWLGAKATEDFIQKYFLYKDVIKDIKIKKTSKKKKK